MIILIPLMDHSCTGPASGPGTGPGPGPGHGPGLGPGPVSLPQFEAAFQRLR